MRVLKKGARTTQNKKASMRHTAHMNRLNDARGRSLKVKHAVQGTSL